MRQFTIVVVNMTTTAGPARHKNGEGGRSYGPFPSIMFNPGGNPCTHFTNRVHISLAHGQLTSSSYRLNKQEQKFNDPVLFPSSYTHTHAQQTGSAPVFLRGRSDRFVYRSAMVLSLCGLGVSFYGLYLMATGQMQKKSR